MIFKWKVAISRVQIGREKGGKNDSYLFKPFELMKKNQRYEVKDF